MTTKTIAQKSDTHRSAIMRAVKSKDTTPEMTVRKMVHGMGYRYALHRRDMPGKPDLVFPSRKKIIFVNGCFWHGHNCPRGARLPKANAEYWSAKIGRNVERDAAALAQLQSSEWEVLTIWECETKSADRETLRYRLSEFLNPKPLHNRDIL